MVSTMTKTNFNGTPKRQIEVDQEFFALPQKEKETYANDPSTGKFEGYGTKMTKTNFNGTPKQGDLCK